MFLNQNRLNESDAPLRLPHALICAIVLTLSVQILPARATDIDKCEDPPCGYGCSGFCTSQCGDPVCDPRCAAYGAYECDDPEDDEYEECEGAASESCPACVDGDGDALHLRFTTGNIWTSVKVFSALSEDQTDLGFELQYDSLRAQIGGPVGFGWTHSYHHELLPIVDSPNQEMKYRAALDGMRTMAGRYAAALATRSGATSRQAYEQIRGGLERRFESQLRSQIWRQHAFRRDVNGAFIAPRGRSAQLLWISDHYELRTPDGTRRVFDTANRLSEIYDPQGRVTRFAYGYGDTRLTQVTSPYGRQVILQYNAQGRVSIINHPDGRQTTLGYDANGNLTSITDPLGKTQSFQYDDQHRITRETLKNGRFYQAGYGTNPDSRTIYDQNNNIVLSATSVGGFPATRQDPISPGIVVVTDGRGQTSEIQRDKLGRLLQKTWPDGGIYQRHYGGPLDGAHRNRIVWIQNENGLTRSFVWNSDGVLTSAMDTAGQTTLFAHGHANKTLITQVTEPDGDVWQYQYDTQGRLVRLTDPIIETPTDAVETGIYQLYGDTEEIPPGVPSLPGRLKKATYTDRQGHVQVMEYTASGNLSKRTEGYGHVNLIAEYQADSMGWRTQETVTRSQQDQATTNWTYDGMGRLLTSTVVMANGPNLTETRGYDEHGNLTSVTNPRGHVTRYTYDLRNRLVARTVAEGSLNLGTTWTPDGNGNIVAQTDPNGHVTTYEYTGHDYLARIIDPAGYRTVYTRDGVGNPLQVQRALQSGANPTLYRTIAYQYDAYNRVTSKTEDPGGLGLVTTYGYSGPANCACAATPGRDLVHKITDPRGKVTYRDYDKLDRLVRVIRKVGDTQDNGGDNDDAITRREYDRDGNLTAMVYPEGERVEATYDAADRRQTITALGPNGNLTLTLNRDGAGNVTSATLPNGNIVTLVYDRADRLTGYSDSIGAIGSLTYDANGNVLTRSDGLGHAWTFEYDPADRLTKRYDPLVESPDTFTSYAYELATLTETVNHKGIRTRYQYDALDRTTAAIENYAGAGDTAGTSTHYTYNSTGEVLSLADHNGNTTGYQYDAAGRLTRVIYPDNDGQGAGVVQFTRDAVGNMLTRTDQKGVVTTYTYDDLNRLLSRAYSAGGGTETFTWNRSSRLLTANNPDVQLGFTYDSLRRLTSATQAFMLAPAASYTTTFSYTVGGENTIGGTRTINYPAGRQVTETYDKGWRMTAVSGGTGIGASWTYDLADRQTAATLGNGVSSLFEFDVNDRLSRVRHAKDATTLFEVRFGYDAEGNRTYTRDEFQTTRSELYTHDARDRLRAFGRGTLNAEGSAITTPLNHSKLPSAQGWTNLDRRGNWPSFDQTLNGTTKTQVRTFNAVNEYLTVDPDGAGGEPAVTLDHDPNGNLTVDPRGFNAGDGTVTPTGQWYTYDAENRLIGVVRADDEVPVLNIRYDALGRRVESTVQINLSTGWPVSPQVTRHVYAGLKVTEEYTVAGGTSTRAREFVWGRRFTEPVALIDWTTAGAVGAGTAEPLHYLRSALGSVVALTNAAGQAVERYAYDPYGRTNIFDAAGVWKGFSPYGNPFLWTGQRYDASTTLYHFWARSYSPWSGRWLQRDPLGYVDGVNLYEYVGSMAMGLVDPLGLWVGDETDCRRCHPPRNPLPVQRDPDEELGHDDDPICIAGTRPHPRYLRRIWSEYTGKPWPKEPNGRNHDATHDTPIADGGEPKDPRNIKPQPHEEHMRRHIENKDFSRWAKRRGFINFEAMRATAITVGTALNAAGSAARSLLGDVAFGLSDFSGVIRMQMESFTPRPSLPSHGPGLIEYNLVGWIADPKGESDGNIDAPPHR